MERWIFIFNITKSSSCRGGASVDWDSRVIDLRDVRAVRTGSASPAPWPRERERVAQIAAPHRRRRDDQLRGPGDARKPRPTRAPGTLVLAPRRRTCMLMNEPPLPEAVANAVVADSLPLGAGASLGAGAPPLLSPSALVSQPGRAVLPTCSACRMQSGGCTDGVWV